MLCSCFRREGQDTSGYFMLAQPNGTEEGSLAVAFCDMDESTYSTVTETRLGEVEVEAQAGNTYLTRYVSRRRIPFGSLSATLGVGAAVTPQ